MFRIVRCPSIAKLVRLIWSADVVHLAGPALVPLVVSLILRKPTVIEHHAFSVACPNGQFFFEPTKSLCPNNFLQRRYGECVSCNRASMGVVSSAAKIPLTGIRRWLSNKATANVMPTDWIAHVLAMSRSKTIAHGIPAAPDALHDAASEGTFAFQGRLVTTKGVELLMGAIEKLLEVGIRPRLTVIGDGPQMRILRSRAERIGAEIAFLGHVDETLLGNELEKVATVVMPSIAGEVFGLVALENMLRGKLLLVSDLGSLKEVVGNAGLLFRNGDVSGLASRMKEILENPLLVKTLGEAARNRGRTEFSFEKMIESHLCLYRKVLAR